MKAIRFGEFGGPEVLRLDEVPDPVAGPGEVLLGIEAAGVNPTDISTRSGRGATSAGFTFPAMLGREAAGLVQAVGDGVTSVAVGDRVLLRSAAYAYAEKAVSSAGNIYKIPDGLGTVDASTIVVTYSTAWDAVVNRAQVQAGQTVLVQGAAGGVGVAAVQIAKSIGATVIATASSVEKLAFAAAQGADHGVDYSGGAYAAKVKEIAGGSGVDAIIDGVGGNAFLESFNCLKPDGCIVVYGAASGREVLMNLTTLFRLRARVMGSGGGGASRKDMETIIEMFGAGKLTPTVERTWPLAEAAEAQRHVEERRVIGKVALTV